MRRRRRSRGLPALLACIVAAALAAGCERTDEARPAPPPSSSPALLVNGDIDGLPATVAELPPTDAEGFRDLLGALEGSPVVVNLWASWCEPCTREMPMLAEAAGAHPQVQFLGVDTLDAREGAEAFIAAYEVPFPSLFDPDGAIRTDLGGFGLPVTAFFDADGNEVATVSGELDEATLDEQLRAIGA